MKSFTRLQKESNRIGAEFLTTELDTAFTFLEVANTTASGETRERNRNHAHVAYKTIQRMQPRVVMINPQKDEFMRRLAELKRRLEELGFDVA
ncbi:MAG TPA: hypothetical protein VGM11_09140 [Acidobacteriaceae bacterium]|jgi:hypothetical protein